MNPNTFATVGSVLSCILFWLNNFLGRKYYTFQDVFRKETESKNGCFIRRKDIESAEVSYFDGNDDILTARVTLIMQELLDRLSPLLSLFDVVNPLCIYDSTGQVVYASPKLLHLLQVEEVAELSFFNRFAVPLREELLQNAWESVLADQSQSVVFSVSLETSSEQSLECSLHHLKPFLESPPLVAMVVRESVTDQDLLKALLAESKQQLDSFLNHPSLGVAHVSLEGMIGQRNDRFCDMMKVAKDGDVSMESLMYPGESFINLKMQRHLFEADNHYVARKHFLSKGQEFWLKVKVSLIKFPESNPYLLVTLEEATTFPVKLRRIHRKTKRQSSDS